MNKTIKLSSRIGATTGVGILSWKGHKTLENSLQSYEKIGFRDFFDEVKIVFQEVSEDDKALALKYAYDYIGTKNNLGIQKGHQLICDNLKTDYVLILENDNPIIEDYQTTFNRLKESLKLLKDNTIDIMRLRHRFNFGEGFSLEKYLRYYDIKCLHKKFSCEKIKKTSKLNSFLKLLKRTFRPSKAKRLAGYCLYYEQNPETIFPQYIKKIDHEVFSVDSQIITWTNQGVILKRELYAKLLKYANNNHSTKTANGFQDLEKPLNRKWWREQNFKIGVCDGIFTHNRFDDSWRKTHHAFNVRISK